MDAALILQSLTTLYEGLRDWAAAGKADEKGAERHVARRREAVGRVLAAVVATTAYIHDRDKGEMSRPRETELALLWQAAATAVEEFDQGLYESASLKAMGWADPAKWSRAEGKEALIRLDLIEAQCRWLQKAA